ncbi:hypothetical protein [Bordetella bronchiseptica]|nr:hypothetical protein [Bordetella bronchiseptica]
MNSTGQTGGNPYLAAVHSTLPRLLALFDSNPISPTMGLGDRLYWSWKLKDFANGTFQGAINGLARLYVHDLLPVHMSRASILTRIDRMFMAVNRIRRRNGSLEEAFPHESSFCVTALVAYDLLVAVRLLRQRVPEQTLQRWLSVIAPLIRFLETAEETHGVISNHLLTAVAALEHWADISEQGASRRGRVLLDRVLANASPEGWMREYEGADPGYQSLALVYLADIHAIRPGYALGETIQGCLHFLSHFVHPDGTFGGLYGSRNTRFFSPGGIRTLAMEFDEARAICETMEPSIQKQIVVGLVSTDESNLIPMFNSYCMAAQAWVQDTPERNNHTQAAYRLPCHRELAAITHFPQAGLWIRRGTSGSYTIVSTHKGGVHYHYPANGPGQLNAGVALQHASTGSWATSQAYDPECTVEFDETGITIQAAVRPVSIMYPTPGRFLVLRMLNLTVMRNHRLGNLVKNILATLLITRKRQQVGTLTRRLRFAGDELLVEDRLSNLLPGYEQVETGTFSSLHMASQGYWQRSDDCNDSTT